MTFLILYKVIDALRLLVPDQRQNVRMHQYEQRYTTEHDFEREKHTLRLIKGEKRMKVYSFQLKRVSFNIFVSGRRISSQDPGELVPLSNPDNPVTRRGHWTEKRDNELYKEDDVDKLRVCSCRV